MKLYLLIVTLSIAVIAGEKDKCGCCPDPCCCTCVTTEDVPGVECPTTTTTTSTTTTSTTTTTTTTTSTTTEFIPECNSTLDVAFVLDSSGSVGPDWPVALQFVKDIISAFDNVGEDGARFSLVTYDSNVSVAFDFCDEETNNGQEFLLDAINPDDIPLMGTTTNTPGALEVADNEIFTPPCDRPESPNVAIVITDGRANIRTNELPDIAKNLQDKVECVVAIGVTGAIDVGQLNTIAMCNGERKVLEVTDFAALRDELASLLFTVCEDIPTRAPKTTTLKPTSAPRPTRTPKPPRPTLAPCTPSPPSFKEECFCCCPPPSGYGPKHATCGC